MARRLDQRAKVQGGTTDAAQPAAAAPEQAFLWNRLAVVPVIMWLALVISAYVLLAWEPWAPTRREVPGLAEAERAFWPLLLTLAAGGLLTRHVLQPRTACDRSAANLPARQDEDRTAP